MACDAITLVTVGRARDASTEGTLSPRSILNARTALPLSASTSHRSAEPSLT
jgi:hypothetical protein